MIYTILLIFISIIEMCFGFNALQTPITSFSPPNPFMNSPIHSSINRRYPVATSSDFGNLLMSSSKPGTQSIVAIPLYLRNNLSKYPSIFELLSSNGFTQNQPKSKKVSDNPSVGISFAKKPLFENSKQNDFVSNYSNQRYRTQTQKDMKLNTKDEPKTGRHSNDDNKYGAKESFDSSVPQKTQWSSPLSTDNPPQSRYNKPKETSYFRPTVPQKSTIEEERKQSQTQYESVFKGFANKFTENQNNEQKSEDITDFGPTEEIKIISQTFANKNNYQTYPQSGSNDGGVFNRERVPEKSSYGSPQTYSQSSDNSDEGPNGQNYRYIESGVREDNYFGKSPNKHQNQDTNDFEIINKNNDYQYRSASPRIRSYDRLTHSTQLTTPTNPYTSRPINSRQTYDNNYVTSKPLTSSSLSPILSNDDSSQSISSDNYNSNFEPIVSSNSYSNNFQVISSSSGLESQPNTYSASPSVHSSNVYNSEIPSNSQNNNIYKTESKSQMTSITNPNYSSDYPNSDDTDCYEDITNDYKSSQLLQTIKTKNSKQESDSKFNDRDYFEAEELDPSKLDFKIVHLPVSILRRLIGTGDIGLPGYQ